MMTPLKKQWAELSEELAEARMNEEYYRQELVEAERLQEYWGDVADNVEYLIEELEEEMDKESEA